MGIYSEYLEKNMNFPETIDSQIYRFVSSPNLGAQPISKNQKIAGMNFEWNKYVRQLFPESKV